MSAKVIRRDSCGLANTRGFINLHSPTRHLLDPWSFHRKRRKCASMDVSGVELDLVTQNANWKLNRGTRLRKNRNALEYHHPTNGSWLRITDRDITIDHQLVIRKLVFPELPAAFVLTMRTRRFTDCRLMLTNVPRIRAYIIRRIIATVRAWIRVRTWPSDGSFQACHWEKEESRKREKERERERKGREGANLINVKLDSTNNIQVAAR